MFFFGFFEGFSMVNANILSLKKTYNWSKQILRVFGLQYRITSTSAYFFAIFGLYFTAGQKNQHKRMNLFFPSPLKKC
jgi:hypothetical protein